MKKFVRLAVLATVVLVIGGGAILLAANLYVQSPPVQQQIRQALVSSLKMPAELTKTTLTPWEGLRIDGITVRPDRTPAQPAAPDFLKADSFRVRFAFWPLLKRQFVVQQVLLDRPQLTWAQNAEGRWQFPPGETPEVKEPKHPKKPRSPAASETVEAPNPPSAPANAAPPVAAASPAGEEPVSAPGMTPNPTPEPKAPKGFSVAVDKFKLRHGALEFLDKAAQSVGRFEEVNLDGRITGLGQAAGALWFDRVILPRVGLSLTDFHSRFEYDDAVGLTVSDGKGELAGGKVTMEYRLRTQEAGSPFAVQCRIDNAMLEQLIPQTEGGDPIVRGRLQGSVELKGLSDDADTRHGSAELRLSDAQFRSLPILQTLGDALHINDLSHPQLKEAKINCRLDGGTLFVESLDLVSMDSQISAQGSYQIAEDRLEMRARLTIDRAISRQLPQFIEGVFTPCGDEAPGSRYIDFPVTGSLANPSTNLRERLLSGSLNSLLQNMTSPKPKPKNPNKKPKPNDVPPSDASTDNSQ